MLVTLPLISTIKRSTSHWSVFFYARFSRFSLAKFYKAVIYLVWRFYLNYVDVKKQLKRAIGYFKNLASSFVYSDNKISIVLSKTTLKRFLRYAIGSFCRPIFSNFRILHFPIWNASSVLTLRFRSDPIFYLNWGLLKILRADSARSMSLFWLIRAAKSLVRHDSPIWMASIFNLSSAVYCMTSFWSISTSYAKLLFASSSWDSVSLMLRLVCGSRPSFRYMLFGDRLDLV